MGKNICVPGTGMEVKTVTVREVSILNDTGGTEILPKGRYKVAVTRTWDDYETGGHGAGRLVRDEDIAVARKAGTTGYTPKDFGKYGEKMHMEVVKAAREFDPAKVYFSFFDVVAYKGKSSRETSGKEA